MVLGFSHQPERATRGVPLDAHTSGGLRPLALNARREPHFQHHSPGGVALRLTPDISSASERGCLNPRGQA